MEVKVEETSPSAVNGLEENPTSSTGKNGKKKAKRKNKSKNTTGSLEQQQVSSQQDVTNVSSETSIKKQNGVSKPEHGQVEEISVKLEQTLQLSNYGLTNGTQSGSESQPAAKAEPATTGGGKKRHRNKQKSKGQPANAESGSGPTVAQQPQPTSDSSKKDPQESTTTNTTTVAPNAVVPSQETAPPVEKEEEPPKPLITYQVYESELQMPSIMSLIQKDLSEPYSIYTYRYFIHNWPRLCFLALHEQRCVGAIVCKLDIHRQNIRRGYIAMLAVDKDYRKLKIGTTLVQKAIQAMLEDNADEVVLETEITNRPALRLYENLGFVRDKRLFHYYLNGVDALRLKLWFR